MKILVVDDEKLIAWAIQRLLEKRGHEVHVANDIERARTFLVSNTYDLVICDYLMPEGKGSCLIEAANLKADGTKSIVMSGALSQAGIRELQVDAFIEKPFLLEELEVVIDDLFKKTSN